jgi:hypothetical protein
MPRGVRYHSEVFRAVLDEAAEKLALSSKGATAFKHSGIRGDERAASLAEFLREHLPGDFDVAKGEAIDYKDARTGQLDLVVYDRSGSSPILIRNENILLPCESLYVVIEVKTTLTQDELNNAYLSAVKVRSLRPFKKQFVPARPDGAPADDHNYRCLYVVFAYDTNLGAEDWLNKEFVRIQSASGSTGAGLDVVDRVVVLNRGMINPGNFAGKAAVQDDVNIFLEFYLHVVNFINRERDRRPPVDWQVYSARSFPGWIKLT